MKNARFKLTTFAAAMVVTGLAHSASNSASAPRGAGVTVESMNGEIASAIGPEHCTAVETPGAIDLVTSPPSMRPIPTSIDLSHATKTTPEKTLTVYSTTYADDYCQGTSTPNSKLASGKQSLVIDRTQTYPRYILTTTLQCSDGRSPSEKKFVIKCDLNF